MNLLIPGALPGAFLGALLLSGPLHVPGLPHASGGDRVSVAHGWPEPEHPGAAWPLDPRPEVLAGFTPPSSNFSAGHRGVDLLGTRGAPVHAALGGQVSFAGTVAGRGVVVVDHGHYRTTYEPVRARVRRGDRVATGQVIGTLQAGRSHCAPRSCLHWGLIRDGMYRDPLSLLGAARVRLLPLGPQARG